MAMTEPKPATGDPTAVGQPPPADPPVGEQPPADPPEPATEQAAPPAPADEPPAQEPPADEPPAQEPPAEEPPAEEPPAEEPPAEEAPAEEAPAEEAPAEPADEAPAGDPGESPPEPAESLPEPAEAPESAEAAPPPRPGRARRFGPTRLVVALLLGLLGFSFAIQVRNVAEDPTVAALGEEDLVRILANLDAHEERLRQDIDELQDTRRRLTTAGESRQEALAEAARRADELGILAGTLPAAGPGVTVRLSGDPTTITDARLLDAVQELRGAGAEAIQIQGADSEPVRVVASTYFLSTETGVLVDGRLLRSPYTLVAIGEPQTLTPALHIPGGVVESVRQGGGTVTVHEDPGGVEVTAVRQPEPLRHARPDS
jgi:uncharacterized protein YlxW (UPF0749 family)